MRHGRHPGLGLGLALLSAAAFSTSGSFARSLTAAGWSPGAEVTARVSAAVVLLAVPAVLALRRRRVPRRAVGVVTAYGLVAVAGCQMFFFTAVQSLSVGVALLIEYLGIVLVVGWLWLRHGQRPRRLTAVGSLTAVAGLALVLDLVGGGARLDLVGVLWALAAAVGLAVYFLLSARADVDLPPVAMAGAAMAVGAVTLLGLGAARLLPMHATFGAVTVAGHRTSWLVPVAGLSVLAAAFAYIAGIAAARLLGPRLSAFVGLTEVVFAVLVAWLLLGQLPTGVQLAGGALIVTGIALVRLDELRPAAPPGGQPPSRLPQSATA